MPRHRQERQGKQAAEYYRTHEDVSLTAAGEIYGISHTTVGKYLNPNEIRPPSRPFRGYSKEDLKNAEDLYVGGKSILRAAKGSFVPHERLRQELHNKKLVRGKSESISLGRRFMNRIRRKPIDLGPTLEGMAIKRTQLDPFGLFVEDKK